MSALALSALLCLVSAVAYAGGAIVQERVASAATSRPYAPVRQAGWYAAIALNGFGALLHVVALAYGPLSLVQPLGALTIVFALPMAAVFVGRRSSGAAWRGAVLATVGLAGLLALTGGGGRAEQSLSGAEQSTLLAATGAGVAVLFLAARKVRRATVRSVLLAVAAGAAFGMASVFTKSVAETFAPDALVSLWPELTSVAALAGAGLLLSQAAYRGAGLTAPLATVTVANPVVAAAVGIAMFDEGFRYGAAGAAAAVVSAALAGAGLVLLTVAPRRAEGTVPAGSTRDAAANTAPATTSVAAVDTAPAPAPGAVVVPAGAEATAATPGSDVDAVGPQVLQRVDVGAVAGPAAHLEVQVRPGRVAGRAGAADALPAGDRRAGFDGERRQVRVLGVPAVGVPDDDLVAVRTGPAR